MLHNLDTDLYFQFCDPPCIPFCSRLAWTHDVFWDKGIDSSEGQWLWNLLSIFVTHFQEESTASIKKRELWKARSKVFKYNHSKWKVRLILWERDWFRISWVPVYHLSWVSWLKSVISTLKSLGAGVQPRVRGHLGVESELKIIMSCTAKPYLKKDKK